MHISFRWKVILGVTGTGTLTVVLALLTFTTIETDRLKQQVVSEIETVARIANAGISDALIRSDFESAQDSLLVLKANPHIRSVAVYDQLGKPFVWYRWDGKPDRVVKMGTAENLPAVLPRKAPYVKTVVDETAIRLVKSINQDGKRLGTIYLQADRYALDETISGYHRNAIILSAAGALLSLLLSLLIQYLAAKPIRQVVAVLREFAQGDADLTRRLPTAVKGELGEMANWFNLYVENIQQLVCQFGDTIIELSQATASLLEESQQANGSIVSQQQQIDHVATSVTEMFTTVQEVASNVALSARDAEQADIESKLGREVVDDTMQSIETLAHDIEIAAEVITKLQHDSENIGSVLEVIRDIAEQTNLLALNAAIEAARAGEQGRGFAVVADEVRTLASRTQHSTREIQEIIEKLQSGAKEAVEVMDKGRNQAHASVKQAEKAKTSLTVITRAVETIKEMSNQIACTSDEQSSATEKINNNIISMTRVAEVTCTSSKEVESHTIELAQLSSRLQYLMNRLIVS